MITTHITENITEVLPGFIRNIGTAARFVSMTTVTPVDARKTNNPFAGAVKVARRNGLVNVNHPRRVQRRMDEAGVDATYVPGTTWYVHEQDATGKPLALCQSKKDATKKYLQYFPHRNLGTHYEHNGRRLTPDEVKVLMTFVRETPKSEFKEPVITLAMTSIKSIKFRNVKLG
jgi:hypothetical protein